MAYALGVGVDTTAFQGAPEEWTDVAAESEVTTAPKVVSAGGVPVLLMRSGTSITAMYDRCTHRGGPLHEGSVEDGCITCPWHGSQFRLADGAVAKGPATRPQPTFEVRVSDGRVQVRRAEEPRSLRLNPVGS
jgi:nitrite reductase/ring-hydroxylating ferredoxin subunit